MPTLKNAASEEKNVSDMPAIRKVSSRWTPLLTKQFTPISTFFLDEYHALNPPIRYSEALFIIHLMRHKWGKEAPYPSWATLSRYMGISSTAVRNIARTLQTKGYIYKSKRSSGTKTNNFHLEPLLKALEKHFLEVSVKDNPKTANFLRSIGKRKIEESSGTDGF